MSEFNVLDVGCGTSPTGNVNCDLFIKEGYHRTRKRGKQGPQLKPERIPNFVVCDVRHLPFKSGAFDTVVCNHVIEHLPQPVSLLKELHRVSRRRVLLHCPHKLGDRLTGKFDCHIGFFNRSWFVAAADKLNVCCVTRVSKVKFLPFEFMPLFSVPLELEVEMWKK